ncbi:hypothetical protein MMC11_006229 [Xylographa trunciseda]|nr:hypothetical protein [Xylographa trunciseda]
MAGHHPISLRSTSLCLRQACTAQPTTRSFSSTTARRKNGPLPTFPPTSSPPLDALLSTFRTNVFLPSHLLSAQRALIYRRSQQHQLLGEDPITVSLPTTASSDSAEETFTLVPLDHLRDEPATAASFHALLALLRTKADWHILPSFLEGLKTSRRKLSPAMVEKMVRRAAAAGQMGVVGECARMVARTGVKVDNVGLAREVLWGTLQTVVLAGWTPKGTAVAAKQAEGMLVLMEDPAHVGGKRGAKGTDPRRAPEVVGVGMGLMALRAVKSGEGDVGAKVEKLARKMLDCWKHAELDVKEGSWWDANRALLMWAPVEVGIQSAMKVLGARTELGKRLGAVLKADVGPVVQKAKSILQRDGPTEGRRRGMVMYDELQKALV